MQQLSMPSKCTAENVEKAVVGPVRQNVVACKFCLVDAQLNLRDYADTLEMMG
jgi:hypothetical protein